jgi:phosphoribosyl 1,2-cyclic phosphodiesterase
VEVRAEDESVLVLDAGTGIRRLGGTLSCRVRRVDILLTHLHMDHIQGLGFFAPLFDPRVEVHVWGPASATLSLSERVARYLSPPLFPVHIRDLPCTISLHEIADSEFEIGPFRVASALVVHPNPTVGYRIEGDGTVLTYLPDHEPALGLPGGFVDRVWTSGGWLAAGADLLIHDAQYTAQEYPRHMGWGHSSINQALEFAQLTSAKQVVLFHHDPGHDDGTLDHIFAAAMASAPRGLSVTPAREGMALPLGS